MLTRRADGSFDLKLDDRARTILTALLTDLAESLVEAPDDPNLSRLHPPAYPDDAEADAAYQLLAGEELRSSHQQAIAAAVTSLQQDRLTEAELWAWLQALNAVRLVVGTQLEITEDDHGPLHRPATDDADASRWAIYDFTTYVQHEVVEALS